MTQREQRCNENKRKNNNNKKKIKNHHSYDCKMYCLYFRAKFLSEQQFVLM